MPKSSALLAVCFTAGLLGGLANSIFVWAGGEWGLTALLGVKIAPSLKLSWLYPRMVWGGIWGVPYFFTVGAPRYRRQWIRKALLISLLPSAVMLCYIFPNLKSKGLAGLELGLLTPAFVVTANLVWGAFTGFFTRLFWGR